MTAAVVGAIGSADWSPKLGDFGQVVEGPADVAQCLSIILSTPRGSSPLRPLFGCEAWQHIDKPLQAARPLIVRDVLEAIALWEPRAAVRRVLVQAINPSGLLIRLELLAYGEPLSLDLPIFAAVPDAPVGPEYVLDESLYFTSDLVD